MYFQRGTEKYKDGKEDKKYAMAWKKEYASVEDEVTTTRGVGGGGGHQHLDPTYQSIYFIV